MRVTVRLFAGLRERAGTGRREIELSAGATVADVWDALELGGEEPGGGRAEAHVGRSRPVAAAVGGLGFALGSLMLGMPFTAITFFAMQRFLHQPVRAASTRSGRPTRAS